MCVCLIDESTCCDEDFTWVCNTKEKSRESNPLQSSYSSLTRVVSHGTVTPNQNSNTTQPNSIKFGKSAKPSSLDRRRVLNRNRQERDSKSRSAHSLQESSVSTDFGEPTAKGINLFQFIVSKCTSPLIITKQNKNQKKIIIEGHQFYKSGGNGNTNTSNSNKYHKHHSHAHHRSKPPPIFWERPYFPHWEPDPQPCNNYYGGNGSREDVRMHEYGRRHHDYYRYDSDGTINVAKQKMILTMPTGVGGTTMGNYSGDRIGHTADDNCCRYYKKPVPIKSYCPCEYNTTSTAPAPAPSWAKRSQVG